MSIFFGVVLAILVFLFGLYLTHKTAESFIEDGVGRWAWFVITITFWSAILTGTIKLASQVTAKGPCVQYETQMHFNPATKTMMPAKVCVNRGEWVNE